MNYPPHHSFDARIGTDDGTSSHNYSSGHNGSNAPPGRFDELMLQPYSITHLLVTSIILGTVILATIIGNVFVVAAIILERNLHSVANYLIASLAVADLMVASLVMPLAAVNEVSTQWFLGPQICDIWISFDVLCCTSSILHLVAIAMDRYWAVTRIDYIHNRSAKRILFMVAASWTISASISIPPLFGWKDTKQASNVPGQCMISQDWGYTVFSTVGAFYLPLSFMIIIYIKIYSTAKNRIRKKNFRKLQQAKSGPAAALTLNQQPSTPADSTPLTQLSSSVNQSPDQSSNGSALMRSSSSGSDTNRNNNKHHMQQHANNTSPPGSPSPLLKSQTPQHQLRSSSHCLLQPSNSPSGPLLRSKPQHFKNNGGAAICPNYTSEIPGSPGPLLRAANDSAPQTPNQRSTSFLDITKIYQDFRNKTSTSCVVQQTSPKRRERTKEKLEAKRERKAARTLAIITGSFVTCWLPFFIVAIVRPFCGNSCHYPHMLISVIIWLGYFNCLLNPIIYTIFNPDFRTAFRKILFGKYRGSYRRHNARR